jgi:P-type Cu+ transporter
MPQLADAFTEAGEGVRGSIGGRRVAAGRREWVADVIGCDATAPAQQDGSHAGSAETVVWVGQEGRGIIGSLAFRDSLR